MKLSFYLKIVASLLIASSTVWASADKGGNGGDLIRSFFFQKGAQVIDYLERTTEGQTLAREFNLNIHELNRTLSIDVVKVVLAKSLFDNGGSAVDAIGTKGHIKLCSECWKYFISQEIDPTELVFHEMLRGAGINDDNFKISKNLRSGMLITNETESNASLEDKNIPVYLLAQYLESAVQLPGSMGRTAETIVDIMQSNRQTIETLMQKKVDLLSSKVVYGQLKTNLIDLKEGNESILNPLILSLTASAMDTLDECRATSVIEKEELRRTTLSLIKKYLQSMTDLTQVLTGAEAETPSITSANLTYDEAVRVSDRSKRIEQTAKNLIEISIALKNKLSSVIEVITCGQNWALAKMYANDWIKYKSATFDNDAVKVFVVGLSRNEEIKIATHQRQVISSNPLGGRVMILSSTTEYQELLKIVPKNLKGVVFMKGQQLCGVITKQSHYMSEMVFDYQIANCSIDGRLKQ